MRVARWTASLGAAAVGLFATAALAQPELLGQPTPDAIGMQPGVTKIQHAQAFFHNGVLLPIITAITLFVLGLLLYCAVRFNKRRNPVPARFTHNTSIEVLWTVAPVLILMFIAIFSFRLLFAYHDAPKADYTVKVTGYQWYWGYEYPDQEIGEITSIMLKEQDAKRLGKPYRLGADNPMVVPVGRNVQLLVTGADVIHAFALPAFGIKADAVPGRVNELWFNAEKTGVFYGQCSELCGVDHAYMPIEIHVVTQPEFDRWVGSQRVAAGLPATVQPVSTAAPALPAAPTAPVQETPSPAAPGVAINPAVPGTTPAPRNPPGTPASPTAPGPNAPPAVGTTPAAPTAPAAPANQTTSVKPGAQLAALNR